jgi:hypothetical protein
LCNRARAPAASQSLPSNLAVAARGDTATCSERLALAPHQAMVTAGADRTNYPSSLRSRNEPRQVFFADAARLIQINVCMTLRSYYIKTCSPSTALFAALAFFLPWGTAAGAEECDWLTENAPTIVCPPPQDVTYSLYGYNYPYVLYVPVSRGFPFLIIESNNPGTPGLNASELLNKAIAQAKRTSHLVVAWRTGLVPRSSCLPFLGLSARTAEATSTRTLFLARQC